MPGRGENGLKDKNRSISQLPAALQASLRSVGIPVRLFDSCSSPGLLTKSPIAVLCVQLWKAAVCLNKQQTQPFSTAEPLLKLLGWACPAVGTHSSTQPLVPQAAAAGLQVRGMLRELTPLLGVSCSFSLIYLFIFFFNKQGSQCSANTTCGTQARASTFKYFYNHIALLSSIKWNHLKTVFIISQMLLISFLMDGKVPGTHSNHVALRLRV